MIKLFNITIVMLSAVFLLTGCSKSSQNVEKKDSILNMQYVENEITKIALNIDVKEVCNTKTNNIKDVIGLASTFNNVAVKEGIEFKRLGMSTTQYIKATQKAIKSGAKTINILNKKKKKTGTVSTSYAAWRACSFAIRALQQKQEANETWRLTVPGDQYKY